MPSNQKVDKDSKESKKTQKSLGNNENSDVNIDDHLNKKNNEAFNDNYNEISQENLNSEDLFPLFLFDQNEAYSKVFEYSKYKIGVFICKSPLKQSDKNNEDTLFVSHNEKKFLFGISDGAGGHPRGMDAAIEVSEGLLQSLEKDLLEGIEEANQRVIDLKAGAKATLSLAQLDLENEHISFHWVGDSEVLFWNAQGSLNFHSTPHSPVGFKVASGMISQEESLHDPDRNFVMSLMGDEFVQIFSTSRFQLKKGHTVLVGSDGLFDNISHEKLTDLVSNATFEEVFEGLAHLSQSQPDGVWLKHDDVSFILFKKVEV